MRQADGNPYHSKSPRWQASQKEKIATFVAPKGSRNMRFTSPRAIYTCLAVSVLAGCGGDTLSADDLNAMLTQVPAPSMVDPVAPEPSPDPGVVNPVDTTPTPVDPAPPVTTDAPINPTAPVETITAPTATAPMETMTAPPETTAPTETTTTAPPETTTTAVETTSDMPTTEPAPVPEGPYAPRTGSFKMLAYSKTAAFRHAEAITTGREMLNAIAAQQGFEVKFTETNEDITVEGLSQYEIVFFLNSTGDIFSAQEQTAYEEWMREHNGAFAGVHSATDTENGWAFYSEVTGQYYNGHTPSADAQGEIQWDAAQLNHVAVKGLPSPWQRQEEWYKFNQSAQWTAKPGFVVLSRVTLNDDGGTRPVSYIREWGNFRSFYTSLGHAGRTFQDQDVRKHIAAGIMWAVRREAEIK